MRATTLLLAGLLMTLSGAASGADTVFSYHGKMLVPEKGNGVQGVKRLAFNLSGQMPAKGTCVKNLTVLSVSDGKYSLKEFLAHGFTEAPHRRAEVCSDAKTGRLSERLYIGVVANSGGDLEASYTWRSNDPAQGKLTDKVTLFANIEYHTSAANGEGHLIAK